MRIAGAVLKGGRMYRAGEEDTLAGQLSQPELDRLKSKGVITGDWESKKEQKVVEQVSTSFNAATEPPRKAVREGDEMPPDYEAKHLGAGYFTLTAPDGKQVTSDDADEDRYKGRARAIDAAWAHYNTPPTK